MGHTAVSTIKVSKYLSCAVGSGKNYRDNAFCVCYEINDKSKEATLQTIFFPKLGLQIV